MPIVAPTPTRAPLLPDARRPHLFRIPADRPILALDVSQEHLVTALVLPGQARTQERTVPNTAAGIRQLLDRTPPDCCWVLEPTGRYSNLAVDQARAAGRDVLMAEPRRAKSFLRSGPERAKSDRLDSRGLVAYSSAQPLPLYPRPSAVIEQVQQLLSARKGLSQALSRLQQQRRELPHAAAVLEAACAPLREQLRVLEGQLAALATDPDRKAELGATTRLDAVPGVGPVTAAAANACLQLRQFSHPDQFVAYIGLDITVRDSGKKVGKRQVSQRGDAELRRLIFLAAQANLRVAGSPFRQQYDRERSKGLAHTAAVCAVGRKLAKVLWALWKHGGEYTPERVYQQPRRKKPGQTEGTLPGDGSEGPAPPSA